MKWDFQTVGFHAREELVDFTKGKVEKLTNYFDQIVGAEVYLKLVQDGHNETKVAEVKLNIPGNDLFASSQSEAFEKSISETTDKLKRQLDKLKTKMATH